MVVQRHTTSEYQKAFKPSDKCAEIHGTNFDYRVLRRRIEHYHQCDAFTWDDSSETDSESLSGGTHILNKPVGVPYHQYKHDKLNRKYKLQHQKPSGGILNTTVDVAEPLQIETQIFSGQPDDLEGESLTSQPAKLVNRRIQTNCEEDVIRRPSCIVQDEPVRRPKKSTGKPTRPHAQHSFALRKNIPKPRPFSTPLGRPLKSCEPQELDAKERKPPFVPYGFCDKEASLAHKQTFNIHASADIYPSALHAQKRREAIIQKKEEELRNSSLQEHRKRALFNDFNEKVRRETKQWDTEYRSCFVGYEGGDYARSASARRTPRHRGELLASTL